MRKKVVTFGEIMMRLSPPGFQRFGQARSFDVIYGGGEANVAAALAQFGVPADFVTRLPANELGDACLGYLAAWGVGTSKIARGGDRLGIYFLEMGAVQRGSKVVYDRAGSSLASCEPGMIDWSAAFADADWFHWTGITPSISESLAATCLEGLKAARDAGRTISCDLNYRSKLWKWGKRAGEVMPEMVALCDIALGNEEDAEKVFGIKAEDADVEAGSVSGEAYRSVCEQLRQRFPSLKLVAITLRGSLSASHNTWSGVLFDGETLYQAPTYDLTHIVDRVGGGDAFMGGLIYGLKSYGDDRQKALDFAAAASCLKHTVFGDFNMASVAEVEALMAGGGAGRVQR